MPIIHYYWRKKSQIDNIHVLPNPLSPENLYHTFKQNYIIQEDQILKNNELLKQFTLNSIKIQCYTLPKHILIKLN